MWALLLEGTHPGLATDVIYVAGDRVVTDPLCKPFSMGRNMFCVHSKKRMGDQPELREAKQRTNRRTLSAMLKALKEARPLSALVPPHPDTPPYPETETAPRAVTFPKSNDQTSYSTWIPYPTIPQSCAVGCTPQNVTSQGRDGSAVVFATFPQGRQNCVCSGLGSAPAQQGNTLL